MTLIAISQISKTFGGKVFALRDVSCDISGNVIGLLGPNGAGKSTLLKCLLGLMPFEGDATVLGLNAKQQGAAVRERVGYMPEQDLLMPNMSAVALCTYAAELSGLPRTEAVQRAHASLYYAGLEEKRYQPVETYSTGQRQRVKLAQALVHDPELLFLDEPTNGLDPKARGEMLELIAELPARRGCAVILSTHLLGDVERVCDQAVIMHRGSVRFSGTIDELRDTRTGAREFTVQLRDQPEVMVAALQARGMTASVSSPFSVAVTLGASDTTHTLFVTAAAAGVQLRGVEESKDTVEAAFLRVIGEANAQPNAASNAASTGTAPIAPRSTP